MCRNRDFLVRQRTAVKNRIRDQAYRLCTDFDNFNSGTLNMLRRQSPVLNELVGHLIGINGRIRSMERTIKEETARYEAARTVDSVPSIGPYGALGIVAEIGKIGRFPSEDCIFSYAGLVPRVHQSGSREWKGHIAQGNMFLRYLFIECVQMHIAVAPDSPVTAAYIRIKKAGGSKDCKDSSSPEAAAHDILHAQKTDGLR